MSNPSLREKLLSLLKAAGDVEPACVLAQVVGCTTFDAVHILSVEARAGTVEQLTKDGRLAFRFIQPT